MQTDIEIKVSPRVANSPIAIKRVATDALGVDPKSVNYVRVLRRSIDARQREVYVILLVRAYVGENPDDGSLMPVIEYKPVGGSKNAIIVGAGPAGLMAALRLIELGVKPIVIERGKPVEQRQRDISASIRSGIVDPNSNYCFGEGGAGAFSDGKLYTRSRKRGSVERILAILVQHGAPREILIDAHPHIGTDRLPGVIARIRKTILDCGGEVHFGCRVDGLIVKDGVVEGVKTANGPEFHGPVILATGHSARDIYRMLYGSGITVEAKGIAIGVRVEHPQQLIDQIQYHNLEGRGRYLPAAEYTLSTQVEGRGVYSFCMCPGGFIVPAATEPEQLVVNGMSPANRGSKWANSGIVVELRAEDIETSSSNPLALMELQEKLEHRMYAATGSLVAPAQRLADFVAMKSSQDLPKSSYAPGVTPMRVDQLLPMSISRRLRAGMEIFGKKKPGWVTNEAVVIGLESRTSSAVRIPRDNMALHHISLPGLYPCGEGAGYAGGIVSAAIDGERCAEALAAKIYNKNNIYNG